MIIVTGAAGFIGSNLVRKLNDEGYKDIILVDDFSRSDKNKNLENKQIKEKINREIFLQWFTENKYSVDLVFHMGARTDTTEFNREIFDKLNLGYSKEIWSICASANIPLIYASSAATYGKGEFGYRDDHDLPYKLRPLNPYGESKNEFDKWVLQQESQPDYWAGIKFFNVYGPNEYHKGRMASVIFHAYNQIERTGKMKLFRSHRDDYEHGEQLRDFIYVKDVVKVLYFLMKKGDTCGLFNLGTGRARTFNDLVKNTFRAMGTRENIEYIDTPADIRDTYQYFTEAEMDKLKSIGYNYKFFTLEEGIEDYVKNYLRSGIYI
ncbi:MAG: ADP-glyceromanno-heptose 6-epimerase [Bacteroidales bacterium]